MNPQTGHPPGHRPPWKRPRFEDPLNSVWKDEKGMGKTLTDLDRLWHDEQEKKAREIEAIAEEIFNDDE